MIALILLGALALYIVIAMVLTQALMRRGKTTNAKRAIGIASVSLFFLVLTWDEFAGRVYLYGVCAREGGAKAHKTVEVDSANWDKNGKPLFVTSNQNKPTVIFNGQYEFKVGGYAPYSEIFNIRKFQLKLINSSSGEELGTFTRFAFGGGWALRNMPAHHDAVICPSDPQFDFTLIAAVFVKK